MTRIGCLKNSEWRRNEIFSLKSQFVHDHSTIKWPYVKSGLAGNFINIKNIMMTTWRSEFPKSFMISSCLSFKEPRCQAWSQHSEQIEILDSFSFGDDEIIFQDDNALCYRVKRIKAFLQESYIKSMPCPVNCPDLNQVENLWRKQKKCPWEGSIH